MKKLFLLTIALIISSLYSYGAYIKNHPVALTQPDGSIINCFASGDEFYSFLHTQEGYVMQEGEDGFYYFAEKKNNEIVNSQYKVLENNPNELQLIKWIMPDESLLRERLEQHNRQRDFALRQKGLKSPTSQIAKSGKVNNLVIFVTFFDQEEYTDDISIYEKMFNDEELASVKTFYRAASYNTMEVETHFCPEAEGNVVSVQLMQEKGYYMPYHSVSNPIGFPNDNDRRMREKEMLDYVISVASEEYTGDVDFDSDNDNTIDNIVFMIQGPAHPNTGVLWPHRSWYSGTRTFKGKKVLDYNVMLSNMAKSPTEGVGTLCHEFFHSLGAPDLYHYSYDGYELTGKWDLMELTATPPQFMCNLLKYQYTDWVKELPEITQEGEYSLNLASHPTNNIYKVKIPGASSEFLTLEYRKKEGMFDISIPGSGLLVYRINDKQWKVGNASGPPDEIYLFRPGGTTKINGNVNNANFCKEVGRTSISDLTNPRLFFSNGSDMGIEIYDISECGETISFKIGFTTRTIIVSPASSSYEQPLKPTFSWRLINQATSYRIQLAKDEYFQNMVFEDTFTDTSFTLSESLANSNSYYARVKWNSSNKSSDWSEIVKFTTVPNDPEILYPADKSDKVSILPTLTWSSVVNNNIYQVFVAEDKEFENVYFKKNFLSDTVLTITKALELNKTYYCKVKSTTASGYSCESEAISFTTKDKDLVIASQSESSELCKGDPLNIAVSPAGDIGRYEWYLNNELIADAVDSTLTIEEFDDEDEGEYLCKVYSSDESIITESAIITVQIVRPPKIISVPDQIQVDRGDDFVLEVQIDSAGTDVRKNYKFQWFKDEKEISDGAKYSGTSSLTLTVTKAEESDNESTYSLRISTRCGDTVFTNSSKVLLSVSDNFVYKPNSFSISPNPAQESVNISFASKNGDAEILLYDLNGILVANLWKGFVSEGNTNLNLSLKDFNLNSAIYIIAIKTNNEILTNKISIIK
ncbi:MAG: M6 family metalloprotease domain-containing protein [Ignavibacteria bacterium]|jgi:M6 family metalloprotease-like protein|nr:M6 family metalloprotease domain-containing protein [Ignavibacteria bacterium]